jgi:Uncharacterized protein conserved in bacteria
MRNLLRTAAMAGTMAVASVAAAQQYPSGPVTLVVPFGPGGGTDYIGRTFAEALSEVLGESVIVENVAGAGTTIGTAQVANSEPDGLTILVNGSTLAYHPALFDSLPYDVSTDLRPIAFLTEQAYVLLVNNDSEAHSIADLVAMATAAPDTIPYGSAGVGSAMHLSAELLWSELGIDLLHIPYPGTSAAMNDLLAGEIEVVYTTATGGVDMVAAGEVRALGISSLEPSSAMPDVPTIASDAVPGYEHTSWIALFVPADTPEDIVQAIYTATTQALENPALVEAFTSRDLSIRHGTPEEVKTFFDGEVARWGSVIEAAGIEPQ